MLDRFVMNGLTWRVRFTRPDNPILIDRTSNWTVAVTDPETMTIYLADNLHGDFLTRVTLHELSHAVMISYGLVDEIHRFCNKKFWVEAEEFCANLIANYGNEVFSVAYSILGKKAIHIVPYEMSRFVA